MPSEGGFIDFRAFNSIFDGVNSLTETQQSLKAPINSQEAQLGDNFGDTTLPLKRAFEPIAKELLGVEERIRDQARAFDPAVEHYVAYAIQSSGKRLRPALALLSGGATGAILSEHADLAVIVELLFADYLLFVVVGYTGLARLRGLLPGR